MGRVRNGTMMDLDPDPDPVLTRNQLDGSGSENTNVLKVSEPVPITFQILNALT